MEMKRILLWAVMLLYSFHFAGHLHNALTNVPNWSSGSVEDMKRYGAFYHKATNTRFFAPVIFATIFVCIVTLFYLWNHNPLNRNIVIADLLIAVLVLISVFTIFGPMNNYFSRQEYDPILLKTMVNKWVAWNYVRMLVILLGLILSIWNLKVFK